MPAFRPDRCVREEEVGEVSKKLKVLHEGGASESKCKTQELPETLYHMCQSSLWEAAKASGVAYFPPTFEADGHLTHATAVPSRLIETANHFYTAVEGEWVCLEFTRTALKAHGIFVRDEDASPVGGQKVGATWGDWVCPHVIGGIPPAVVDKEYAMNRDGSRFVNIRGLTS